MIQESNQAINKLIEMNNKCAEEASNSIKHKKKQFQQKMQYWYSVKQKKGYIIYGEKVNCTILKK